MAPEETPLLPEEQIAKLEQEVSALQAHNDEVVEELEELGERNTRVEQEVAQIAEIHQALLPDRMPEIHGVRLAARHTAPNQAGGDYYDVMPLNRDADLEPEASDPWLLIIADASGHGPAAAMIMAMIQAVLHGYRGDAKEPGRVMDFVNTEMAKKAVPGSFTTAVLGVLDPMKKEFSYAIAGHHPPLLHRAGGGVRELPSKQAGLPLGVALDGETGQHETHALLPGDAVMLFTDGGLEARNAEDEMFGLQRMMDSLERSTGTPEERLARVDADIAAHRGDRPIDDDMTMLLFQVDG